MIEMFGFGLYGSEIEVVSDTDTQELSGAWAEHYRGKMILRKVCCS